MQPFIALADPTRRRIVELLAERERPVGEIVAEFSVSAPAISQHLKVLKEARLVISRIDGQRRIYSPDPAGLQEIEAWAQRIKRFWDHRLDDLERELRRQDAESSTPINTNTSEPDSIL